MDLKQVLFVYNSQKPGAQDTAQRGVSWCQKRGIQAEATPRREFTAEQVDLVVAIGGDGTLLRVAAVLYPREIPILGVNLGSLGFLAACGAEELAGALEKVVGGGAEIERRARLLLVGTPHTALNDVVFLGLPQVRFTELSLWAAGELALRFAGDGLVVATPTGASAYALAGGGPVVYPSTHCLVVTPVAPHRLGLRPVVLPLDVPLRVRAAYSAEIWVDGDRVGELEGGQELELRLAPHPTLLIRLPGEVGFFSRLQTRLGWSSGG